MVSPSSSIIAQSCLNLEKSIPTKYMDFLLCFDLHCCLHKRFVYVFTQMKTSSVNQLITNTGKSLWSESPQNSLAVTK